MFLTKNDIHEVSIENIAYGGKGIAKINGFTLFVDNAIPGDIVEIKIVKKRKSYAEAKIVNFLKYSSDRIKPPCPYSGICGGCKWQFLNYNQQLIYKQQNVQDTLGHIALIKSITVESTIPSDNIFGYRNKMEFSCSDRRWLLESEMNTKIECMLGLGLHVPGTFYKVLDISSCLLQPNIGNKILQDVRSYIKKSNQLPYGLKSHSGFWRFLVIRYSLEYEQCMVDIVTSTYDEKEVKPLSTLLVSKYNNIVSVINSITAKKAGVATGEYRINLIGSSKIRDKISRYSFDISANSFFQTNTKSAKKLYDVVKLYADLSGNELVLDLYCGIGTIAIYLSDAAKEVIGIEIVKSAITDAKNNCNINDITNCTFIQGDVKDILSDIDVIPDVIIIDPPRSGMHGKVIDKVLNILPDKLIYVSCNPATFARDVLKLKEFYEIEAVQPIDMFPHTFHVEVVSKFNKKRSNF